MKMKLVPDWKSFWKWHSTWIAGVATAIVASWGVFPDDLKSFIPNEWTPAIAGVMFVLFLVGRLRAQP